MENIISILKSLVAIVLYWGPMVVYMINVPRTLHYMQLEGYRNSDYMRWLSKNPKLAFKCGIRQVLGVLGYYVVVTIINAVFLSKMGRMGIAYTLITEWIMLFIVFAVCNIVKSKREKQEIKNAKKPLVYTGRAKRLMFWSFITIIILEACIISTIEAQSMVLYYMLRIVWYSIFIFLAPVNMIISNFLAYTTEKIIDDSYINSARFKLMKKSYRKLIKIGITGSYGKTSTKFILQTILSEKYNVLASPESYNTTMGNVKVIRKMLKPEHQVLISEMGARHRYDIREICDFVRPQIGLITSIGPQHLETFKNIDNIVKAKVELLDSLPTDGVVFLPNDDSHCLKLYNKEKRGKYIYGINDKHADVYAKNIKTTKNGTEFIAVTKQGEIHCVSKLLGEHNVQNILGAIAIAVRLGLTNEQIANGVKKIKPIEHRLQMIDGANGITVIDDAFNSNPVGSKMALDVIKSFDGRKIIITPGMVELRKR